MQYCSDIYAATGIKHFSKGSSYRVNNRRRAYPTAELKITKQQAELHELQSFVYNF